LDFTQACAVLSPSSFYTFCSAVSITMSALFGVEEPLYHIASISAYSFSGFAEAVLA